MRGIYLSAAILFVIGGCSPSGGVNEDLPIPYPAPDIISLATDSVYTVNQITGEMIEPLVISGDTILTGSPIRVKGKRIHHSQVQPPEVLHVGNPTIIPINHRIPFDKKSVIFNTVQLDLFSTSLLTTGNPEAYQLNLRGDTIPTGLPIKTRPVVKKCQHPQPIPASTPTFKDFTNHDLRFVDIPHGLSSSYVRKVIEDRNGNIWLANNETGITHFNGEYITHYTSKEGLAHDQIRSIFEDADGNLWFGAVNGSISRYDGVNFTNYSISSGLSGYTIWSIAQDHNGVMWFGTGGGGVTAFDGTNFTHFTTNEGLCQNNVRTVLTDRKGDLWFGTYGGGISKFDGEKFITLNTDNVLINNYFLCSMEDAEGNLWFGTDGGGLVKIKDSLITQYPKSTGISSPQILDIEQDHEGNMWFATMKGLDKFDGETFLNYSQEEGLTSEVLSSVHEDGQGNLWIGTLGGGVNILNPFSFEHFTQEQGLPDNKILAIEQDSAGNYWFGMLGGGLCKYDGEKLIHYTSQQGLRHNYVFALESDSKGNIWISNYPGGVSKFDGENITIYTENSGLSDKSVYTIIEDSKGTMWFSTYNGGVSSFDGEYFTHYTRENGLIDQLVRTVFEDSKGNLWFGTATGVTKFDGEYFTHFTEQQGLSHHHVGSITEDHAGNMWFGTHGGGVVCFDGTRFICFTEKSGLTNNLVRSVTEDHLHRMWVATNKGLNLIERNDNDGFTILNFGKESGLKGIDFFSNSVLIDEKNDAWWGTGNSLTRLNLDHIPQNRKTPQVNLGQLNINGKFINFNNTDEALLQNAKFNGTAPFRNYPLNLKLTHESNHLTFHFSAIDWFEPHNVRYSYRMKGLNDQWSEITHNAIADYRNLPHGKFTFMVAAVGTDNEWGKPYEYSFEIRPPWWNTWGARISYLVVVAFLLMRYGQWRTYRLKKQHEQLQMKIEMATGELRHQKRLVEQKNKSITDSITYAKRIQDAILPPLRIVERALKESFILYKPKDIVAGDFYWMETIPDPDLPDHNLIVFAVADCTGHGVPGAMMSVLCSNALNRAVLQFNLTEPAAILDKTRDIIVSHFERSDDEVKDGMDIALCIYNEKTQVLKFAGAQRPLWIVTSRSIEAEGLEEPMTITDDSDAEVTNSTYKLYHFKPDRQPIGIYAAPKPFTNHNIQLEKGDTLYMFSDGYPDQFGGPKGKKFKYKPLKEMLIEIQDKSMDEQKEIIKNRFDEWKGGLEQIDDVCAIGIRII